MAITLIRFCFRQSDPAITQHWRALAPRIVLIHPLLYRPMLIRISQRVSHSLVPLFTSHQKPLFPGIHTVVRNRPTCVKCLYHPDYRVVAPQRGRAFSLGHGAPVLFESHHNRKDRARQQTNHLASPSRSSVRPRHPRRRPPPQRFFRPRLRPRARHARRRRFERSRPHHRPPSKYRTARNATSKAGESPHLPVSRGGEEAEAKEEEESR